MKFDSVIKFIREIYNIEKEFIPLHAPVFSGNEKKYLEECIDSTFVSSVGKYVTQFEQMTAEFVGSKYAVAAVNGTAALEIALLLVGVERDTEVITQPLTFVATANAIKHTQAEPVFVDVDLDTMGMSPKSLRTWLEENVELKIMAKQSQPCNKSTGRRISAIVPMHTFGHPCRIDEIIAIANEYSIPVVEDSAESLGSYYKGQHTGTFGQVGIFSYNGNKTITTGGGGMIITDNESIAKRAKHITTTAKVPHPWEYVHDEVGYNYRLTNLAAALGVAQMEQLPTILKSKRDTALEYKKFFSELQSKPQPEFIAEPTNARSNYWLNAIKLENKQARDEFLKFTNEAGIMTRPVWRLMNEMAMFKSCQSGSLSNSQWLESKVINIPSSVRI